MTQCRGNVCIINLVRDGKPSYKADLTKAILDAKPGTEELGVLTVSNLKKERTADSEFVVVKKTSTSTITDKVMIAFSEIDTEAVTKLARAVAKCYERYTKPYKDSKQKIVAAFGKIINQSESFLDEYISSDDVAKVVVALYQNYLTDGTFESNTEIADSIVAQYFSFTPHEEARDLVLDAYKKVQEQKWK